MLAFQSNCSKDCALVDTDEGILLSDEGIDVQPRVSRECCSVVVQGQKDTYLNIYRAYNSW